MINAKTNVTTTLNVKSWTLAKDNNIKMTEALEIGVTSVAVDRGIIDIIELPVNYNKFTKEIARLKERVKELTIENHELLSQKQLSECVPDAETAEKEADDLLNNIMGDKENG